MKISALSSDKRCRVTLSLLLSLFLAVTGGLATGNTPPSQHEPDFNPVTGLSDVTPGKTVELTGKNFPTNKKVQVQICNGRGKDCKEVIVDDDNSNGSTISFKIPDDLQPGRYLLHVQFDGQTKLDVPGELRVLADQVKLVSVYPDPPAPRGDGSFNFEIKGENLGTKDKDTVVLETDKRVALIDQVCDEEKKIRDHCLKLDTKVPGRKLGVIGFHPNGETELKIIIRVGNQLSDPMNVKLKRLTGREAKLWSIVVLIFILGSILWLVRNGMKKVAESKQSLLTTLFFDKLTNSYSLSKCQLLLWSVLTAWGYIYLLICRTFIQGDFTQFPPIPENLPELLGVSAFTTVTVAGVTAAKGSKGAGPLEPSIADFISSGGLVIGERFQFVLWTLVSGFGFVTLLLFTDAGHLLELPKIPDTLLYLTGVSAAGYVGGRLVRKQGPVITNLAIIHANADKTSLEFEVQGEGLCKKATVKIDNVLLGVDAVTLEPVSPENQEGFCNRLKIVLNKAEAVGICWLEVEGGHTLTLVNLDQQSASAKFPTCTGSVG